MWHGVVLSSTGYIKRRTLWSACYTRRVMTETAERPAAEAPAAPTAALLSGHRRPLTIGLVLLVTLVAFEGLAVATALPVVRRDLGGSNCTGSCSACTCSRTWWGSFFAGQQADRSSPAGAFTAGLVLLYRAGDLGSGAVDGRSGRRAGGAGVRRRLHQHSGLRDDCPRVRGRATPADVCSHVQRMGAAGRRGPRARRRGGGTSAGAWSSLASCRCCHST